jgi:uncharacterized repeat protein (TIGR02543 family)
MKKRLISLLLAFSMMLTFLPAGAVSAFAEGNLRTYEYKNCGKTSNTVTVTLSPNSDGDETYTMTIHGTGPMKNYSSSRQAPWYQAIPKIKRLIVDDGVTSLGDGVLRDFSGWYSADSLMEVKLPEGLTYLGDYAFFRAAKLKSITLPNTLTTIGGGAFYECTGLTDITIPSNVKTIDEGAFFGCTGLTSVTIPDNVETLGQGVFRGCTQLTSIHIPKCVKSMGANMFGGCTALTCITFEPGSELTNVASNGGWKLFTDTSSELKVYCEPVLKPKLRGRDVPDERIITTVDVTLVDGDTIKPEKIDYGAKIAALGTPTKPGYTFTGWYTDADCKTRYPDAQLFTNINGITLYAGWKFDPNALVCHQLTVTGGTVTVKYDGSDVTSKLNSNTDATTGKKTYYVPEGAEVTVTLDKTAVPNGKVFDGWSTSLPTGQDYKAESITFSMSNDVNVSATYRDAATDHTTVAIEGLENAVIKEGESKGFTVKVTPNDDAKLSEAFIDFGDKNSEIEYQDKNGEYKPMPKDGLKIDLGDGEVEREFRIAPKETGKQTLTAAVKQDKNELAKDEKDFVVSEMPILTLKDGVITSVTVPSKDGADPEDITEIVKKNANEDGSFNVPEGATVSVAFDKDAFADSGLKFGHWDITGLDDPNAYQNKESFDFEMPAKAVTLKAMTQDASIEDDEPDIVGPIVIGTTVVVGGAVLGYQAYSLGAEFAGKLLNLPYFPSNRSALAMMLWEDAGKPMPESELLYPDVGQEERDMDLQHAARWAMENELIPDLNDEGTAPEEMKFYPDNAVSKIDVLNAWQKAQELKQNA